MKRDVMDRLAAERAADRRAMVDEQLRRRGIRDERVLRAMEQLPREVFMPPGQDTFAYADAACPIDCHQTISQPYMVARMTELLELEGEEKVLEIGTGSAYQAALLGMLARKVYSIEWYAELARQAEQKLARVGIDNVTVRCADGSHGWADQAPFDAILVTAGGPSVPESLKEQLADGGRLVIPVGGEESQTLERVTRQGERFHKEKLLQCRFVKLRGDEGWDR